MGRHESGDRPRRPTSAKLTAPKVVVRPSADGRRSGRTAAFLSGAAALALAALTCAAVAALGVPLGPRTAADVVPVPEPTATLTPVALASAPAHDVFSAVLGTAPAAAWQPAGSISWTAGSPFDASCGRPDQVGAAIAGSRIFVVGKGQVLVSLNAYSAGQGAGAFIEWANLLGTCSAVNSYALPGPGVDALIAWGTKTGGGSAAVLLWRRGDVLASISVPTKGTGGLSQRASEVDSRLLSALAGTCADVDSVLADAARSPWLARPDFTGLLRPLAVTVSQSPAPTPPAGVTPVPDSQVYEPVPAVSYPVRPLDPIWPSALPSPMSQPAQPVRPTPQPSATSVLARIDDPTGPGCGWSFTGQVQPVYDEIQQAALTQGRVDQARLKLKVAQSQWQNDTLAFWTQAGPYVAEVQAFAAYAEEVRQVAVAWDSISVSREAYDTAVAQYNQALGDREVFLVQQQQAQAAYDSAVVLCAAQLTPTLTPTPTSAAPSDSVSSSPAPSDTTSATVSPQPTGSPTVSPSPTNSLSCPPAVPPILSETPPVIPPLPTPPPDPRPSPLPSVSP